MAQIPSQHAKMLVDSRMRDIRRRVEVIQKKLADLQEMGVPCAFCYSSVRNTGSIFTLGDKRITDVIERYRNEILCNLMDGGHSIAQDEGSSLQEIHLILPVLPAPLEDLNRATLQSMIVGILKDLGIRWSDPKPVWWPTDIPFVPPRSVPENFTGNWISALKAVLKSVYGYFSYDVDSYIASKLDTRSSNYRAGPVRSYGEYNKQQSSEDSEEETYSEREENNADEQDELSVDVNEEAGGLEQRSAVTAPTLDASTIIKPHKPPNNRLISSFTVENILMGKQSPSSTSTTSSHSPTSSNSATSIPSPTSSGQVSSSIVGVNWVSHPPVKYTKFTILSPTAMSDEAQKRKKSSDTGQGLKSKDVQESRLTAPVDEGSNPDTKPFHTSQVAYNRHASSDYKPTATSALQVYSLASLPTSSAAIKNPPASTSLTSSARLCTLPVVKTLQGASNTVDGKVVLSKTFPPSQQYVLLVPSTSSSAVSAGVQTVSSGRSHKQSVPPPNSVGNSLVRSGIKTVSFQNPPVAAAAALTSSHSADHSSSRMEGNTLHSRVSGENNFRLIIPKEKNVDNTNKSKFPLHKPQKLRFHMTTVVTKQKKMPVRSSMTVESPSAVVSNAKGATNPVPTSHSHSSDSVLPVESTITRSPNVYSSAAGSKDEASGADLNQVEIGSTTSASAPSRNGIHPRTHIQNGDKSSRKGSSNTRRQKHAPEKSEHQDSIMTHHRGRATRSYTRRKRELTFHLYEEPAKRACKE